MRKLEFFKGWEGISKKILKSQTKVCMIGGLKHQRIQTEYCGYSVRDTYFIIMGENVNYYV